jgi:branched-chain amino acid transport system permease protein
MEYLAHILVVAGIYAILAMSLNLVVGFAGIPAMGHSAFFCVGAYASSLLAADAGVSPWLGILVSAASAAGLGWLTSFATHRVGGDLLALATFGLAVVVHSVAANWNSLTHGQMGVSAIPRFHIAGLSLSTGWAYLPIVLAACVLTFVVIRRIVNSPYGRVLQGMREDEIATASVGKPVSNFKSSVFTLGALFAGIAGTLYAHYITYIDPSSFAPMESFTILLMVVFGGMGSLSGPLVGATILVLLPELLRFVGIPHAVAAPLRQMIYGALLVVLVLARPQGLRGKIKWR